MAERTEGDPREVVLANAELKARAGAVLAGSDALVIGSDTDVVGPGGAVLGKPADPEAARERLRQLAGRTHEVHSGVWIQPIGSDGEPGEGSGGVETTLVGFRELTDAEIDAYVATGEWQGRAGGYAVQGFGSSLITSIDGDLSNVIGLPLPLTAQLLAPLSDGLQTGWEIV